MKCKGQHFYIGQLINQPEYPTDFLLRRQMIKLELGQKIRRPIREQAQLVHQALILRSGLR
jgi:hypothetical protein